MKIYRLCMLLSIIMLALCCMNFGYMVGRFQVLKDRETHCLERNNEKLCIDYVIVNRWIKAEEVDYSEICKNMLR